MDDAPVTIEPSTDGNRRAVVAELLDVASDDVTMGSTMRVTPATPRTPALALSAHNTRSWFSFAGEAGLIQMWVPGDTVNDLDKPHLAIRFHRPDLPTGAHVGLVDVELRAKPVEQGYLTFQVSWFDGDDVGRWTINLHAGLHHVFIPVPLKPDLTWVLVDLDLLPRQDGGTHGEVEIHSVEVTPVT
ncbi:MAG TPA: hypothetical protein VJ978_07650 [Nitriliruptoraceae bacterium]|nr:hypothetical protein [Nitriliruptoraceae bacterium]